MAKAINAKPRKAFNVSAPTRDDKSNTYRIKFNYGGDIKDENNAARAEKFYETWKVGLAKVRGKDAGKKMVLTFESQQADVNKTEGWIVLTDFSKFRNKADNTTWRLDYLYPQGADNAGNWCIDYIQIVHKAWNHKGFGPEFTATRDIIRANAPTLEPLEQDEETGRVSCKIKPDERYRQSADRYDTLYLLEVYDSRTGQTTYPAKSSGDHWVASTTDDDITVSCDVPGRMQLTYKDHIRVHVRTYSRGFGGPSSERQSELYVSWPDPPTIKSVDVSGRNSDDKVTVNLSLGKAREHPTTGVKLEVLANTDYKTADEIPGDARWEATGVQDDGGCTALSTTVAELMPDRGKRSWVRVKAWNQHEGIFYRYSVPKPIEAIERPAPSATSSIAVAEAVAGNDGASARLLIVWQSDDATGTEVSWSTDENAWQSTNAPTTHTFTYDDGAKVVDGTAWPHSATLYVAGLASGTRTYIRARRYMEGETTTYGGYSTTETVTPAVAPGSVVLSAPAYVAEGSDLTLTWTYDGGGTQTSWQLVAGTAVPFTETVDGITRTRSRIDPATRRDVTGGADAWGTHSVPWSRLSALASGGSVSMAVLVSTGGDAVESDAMTVGIAARPSIAVSGVPDVLTAQPMEIAVTSATGTGASLAVNAVVRSVGATRTTPGGDEWQAAGDVVWSDASTVSDWIRRLLEVEYNPSTGLVRRRYGYMPDDGARTIEGDLWDWGEYELTVTATDEETGLTSDPYTKTFRVDYAAKPADLPEETSIVTHDDTDADGMRRIWAEVTLTAPDGVGEGDRMELWRRTPNGTYLVADGIAPGLTVTDMWAPYGTGADLAYVVALRTADGSLTWREYPYELPGDMLRIDFDGTYVELPYNLDLSDEWAKDFEGRAHLDGTVGGYWGQATEHSASVSTDVAVRDPDTAAALYALARHAGPCYVRTPDGYAYEADVQVTPVRRSDSLVVAASLDITEVSLTDEYMAESPVTNDAPEEEAGA